MIDTMPPADALPELTAMAALLSPGRMLIDAQYAQDTLMAMEAQLAAARAGAPLGLVACRADQGHRTVTTQRGRRMKMAHVQLNGLMTSSSTWYSSGVQGVVDAIMSAYEDPEVSGVLLEVNTGGGEIAAGQMLSSTLRNRPKPVVVLGHLVASGGIMASMYADEIMASSTTSRFGSIGVMRTIPTWIFSYYSRYYKDLYSDHSPNKNRGSREYEAKGTMQAWIDELNELALGFQQEVKSARPLKGDVKHTLSGAMFCASAAKARGLIDSEGGLQEALTRLAQLARRNPIS